MNDKQKLEYYRFLREDSRTQLRINQSNLMLIEDLRFWNNLAMVIKNYDINEGYFLLNWVGGVLRDSFGLLC